MMTTSAFEILGPIMVGPSSSHTAGALRIAMVAKTLAPGKIKHARFILHNSFSDTYKGHGTDRALVAGLLGFSTFDTRVKDSFAFAQEAGMSFEFVEAQTDPGLHPNTVDIEMLCDEGSISVRGESLGGGRIQLSSIDGVDVEISGEYPTLFVSHLDRPGVLARLTGILSRYKTNIATMKTYRKDKGGNAYTVFETDETPDQILLDEIRLAKDVHSVSFVKVPGASCAPSDSAFTLNFNNGAELLELCGSRHISIGQVMRQREMELSSCEDCPDTQMQEVLKVMEEECITTIMKPERSLGGLLYGQAKQVYDNNEKLSFPLMGDTLTKATAYAMATLERSSTMGIIVAAPTAGSADVVPGALLAASQALECGTEALIESLWTSCAVGAIIARNASVSGAEGGCQAEVGTAAAMAAAALVELMGGTPQQALSAASIAIANLLGLVCDPVRGLVEYPCQNRNVIGVAAAYTAAQLALSGVMNPIPFDEVVDAMRRVGSALPSALRETAKGGLATAPSAETATCSPCSGCLGCMS